MADNRRNAARFIVEATRGSVVESEHVIHAVASDRRGVLQTWGDPLRPTIPRSAIKSVQALPIVVSGAAAAFDVSQTELALACASHSGEPEHVAAVRVWLDRIGLTEDHLECGPDTPLGEEARKEFYADRTEPAAVYNCCSGKHAGFLTVMRHLDEPVAGYIEAASPVQRLVTAAIEQLTDVDLRACPSGRDGCGIPVFALPLERLALAMARLVDPLDLDPPTAEAAERVVLAAQDAFWVSGSGRTEVAVCAAASEAIVIKSGAEGVFMVGLPERGVGLAIKAADGASRAAKAAVVALLARLGVLNAEQGEPALLRNKAGREIGELRAVVGDPVAATLSPPPGSPGQESIAAR